MSIWKKIADLAMAKAQKEGIVFEDDRMAITGNAMNVIFPYKMPSMKTWIFDDSSRGILNEPFVMGIPEMIDRVIELTGVKGHRVKFLFSKNEFPGFHASIKKDRDDMGGAWYKVDKSNVGEIKLPEGWLCPATLKYFAQMPEYIYLRVEQIIGD